MRRMKNLKGVLLPMVIPMFENGGLDIDGTRRLAERFLSLSSVNGLFALGASSEFMHQSFEGGYCRGRPAHRQRWPFLSACGVWIGHLWI